MYEGEYEELNEQQTKVFEFSAYCYMAAFAFAVCVILYAVKTPYLVTEDYVYFAVKVVLAAIVPGVVGFGGWLLFGKSTTAASTIYFLVFAGLALHGWSGITARGREADRVAALAALPEPRTGAEVVAAVLAGKPLTGDVTWRKPPTPRDNTDDALLVESLESATKAHLSRLNAVARAYVAAIADLDIEEVVNGKRYIAKSQLDRQKISTQRYLAAIAAFRPVVERSVKAYEKAIHDVDLTADARKQVLAAYESAAEPVLPMILELCDTDRDRGEAVLEILELYEKDWGAWKYDRDREKTVFDSEQSQKLHDELAQVVETTARAKRGLMARLGS